MTKDEDDDTQVQADTLLIVYQRGFSDGKRSAQRKPLTDEQARVALGLAYLPGAAVMRDVRNIEAAHGIKELS
jgi:hypothetical protein